MAAPPQAVLFADISGSVGIYAERGDTVGFQLSSRCLRLLSQQVERHGGRVVKELGDAILAIHDDAAGAVRAASDMIVAVHDPTCDLGVEQVRIRVGVTYGTVLHDRNDIFGDTVNVASRLLSLARPDEILLTEATFAVLPAELQRAARSINMLPIRGRPTPVKVYRYLWNEEDDTDPTTETGGTRFEDVLESVRIEIEWSGKTAVVSRRIPKVCIGRGAQNDIIIEHDKVSRSHAEISFRVDRFLLSDRSANGSYLCADNAAPVRLHREEVTLFGNGSIILGTRSGPRVDFRMVVDADAHGDDKETAG
jgi:adenylate cyclase